MKQELIVDNLLLNYEFFGQSGDSKGTLVFLHGWRSEANVWLSVIRELKNSGFTIYALNLPGFGGSQTPGSVFTVGDYARVVAGFIEKLGLKNIVLVGHSFGGRIGIKLAAHHPNAISKLVLADSAGFAVDANKKSAMNIAAKIVKPFFKPKAMQGLRAKIYAAIGAEDYLATPELQKTFVSIVGEDLSSDMQNIQCPTLIITGQNDTDTPLEFGQKMQSLISGSQFVIFEGAAHFSFLDKTKEFSTKLKEFIA